MSQNLKTALTLLIAIALSSSAWVWASHTGDVAREHQDQAWSTVVCHVRNTELVGAAKDQRAAIVKYWNDTLREIQVAPCPPPPK